MFVDQLSYIKKALGCSLILVGLTAQSLMAATIVDLQTQKPLGAIDKNTAGDQVTFSLGNGRALLIPVARNKKIIGHEIRDLLLRETAATTIERAVAVRDLKRNLKW